MKKIITQLCPPIVMHGISKLKKLSRRIKDGSAASHFQDLDVYWNADMAMMLETWGEGNVWSEIQFLMVNCEGRVLDIACGTGKTMEVISKFPALDVYGCDISDFLISKARERGIRSDHLVVCDATATDYPDNYFDYAYSIGSLEHFTEDGILKFISECYRITRKSSFHMIPVSRSGKDEGWIKRDQSYYNNSLNWWLNKYRTVYPNVYVLNSTWEDVISGGQWFICLK